MKRRCILVIIGLSVCPSIFAQKTEPPPIEKHRLAPEGVFFLVERVSVKTDSGVMGFAPGPRVKLVEDKGEKFLVSDGETKFEVVVEKLTNDIDLGALAARQDAASQSAIRQDLQDRLNAYRQSKEKERPVFEQQQREVQQRQARAAAAAANAANPLDKGAYHEKENRHWHHGPFIYRY